MISILLPIFNGENFFEQCFNSIKQQTYQNWKLLIGINGHGLESELYKKFQNKFKDSQKVQIYQYDIKSKPETLNLLAKETNTEFVALIDVDDLWESSKLKKQIPYLKIYDVVGTSGKYIGDKNTKINIEVGPISYEQIFFHNCFINSSVIMKRKDVNFDNVFLDDYNMWFKLISKGRKFYNLNDILVFHRLHTNSFFNGSNNYNVNTLKQKWLKYYGENNIMMNRFGVTVIFSLLREKYTNNEILISLKSILSQTWKGYEIIIVINSDKLINDIKNIINNNISDNDKKYLIVKKISIKTLTKKIPKRQYYNKCMKLGKYNLMAFIEPRDLWKPEKLFHQIFWIHGYDAICIGGEFYNGKKGFQKKLTLPSRDPIATKFYRSAVLFKRNRFTEYPIYYNGKTFLFHRHMNLINVHYP